ncbi:hypothetical protein ES707_14880 [subsurface metagenome]
MYDVFISHASEDKNDFVRPLAQKLSENNVSVWYDEFSLKVGDSLRRSIDYGLKKTKYGVVVLSHNFFNKKWPEWELDGLVQLENSKDDPVILPIWHNISYKEILEYSPPLADKYAINSSLGVDYTVKKLLEVIRPEGTSLQHAKSILENLGYSPPPVTDEWWLDIIEYDGFDSNVYDWSFSVGLLPEKPADRGKVIAKKAIQRLWQEMVKEKNISQVTNPEILLTVIESVPGLPDLLEETLSYTILYAPQLTIKGFGGGFEPAIEDLYQRNTKLKLPRQKDKGGSGLTIDGWSPSCDEEFVLRDPNFGYYQPSTVTGHFVQGELMGPSPKVHEHFDYLVWLLSNSSKWMPENIRSYLLKGFHEWNVWPWHSVPNRHSEDTGALFVLMYKFVDKDKEFTLTRSAFKDLNQRIEWSLKTLEINDEASQILDKFLEGKFIESYINEQKDWKK